MKVLLRVSLRGFENVLSFPIYDKQRKERILAKVTVGNEFGIVFRLMSNENIMSSIEDMFGEKSLGWLSKENTTLIKEFVYSSEFRSESEELYIAFVALRNN